MSAFISEGTRIDNFLYLNRNRWSDFQWDGLEVRNDGALQLSSLPLFDGELPKVSNDPDGPAGIVVASDGTIYLSDPANDRILRIGCNEIVTPVPCIGGKGGAPVQLDTPRGLFIPKYRSSLFVADSENNRIQVFDLASGQLVDIWGEGGVLHELVPDHQSEQLNTPWALTGDHAGNIYVVDYGNQRVLKFNRAGELVRDFWDTLANEHLLTRPSDIAAYSSNDGVRLYIVDEAAHAVFVTDGDGRPVRDAHKLPVTIGPADLKKPMGIAASADAIYVGDNQLDRVLKFSTDDYSYIGDAVGYEGPVAGLAIDYTHDNLFVHSGGNLAPIRLRVRAGYATRGVLWSQTISVSDSPVALHRLQAKLGSISLPVNTHLRLFFHISNDRTDQPEIDLDSDKPFRDSRWKPAQGSTPDPFLDTHDVFIGGPPVRYLWVGALLLSDGRNTPVVRQAFLEFDHHTYLDELPAIYQSDPKSRDFLLRFLSLVETLFQDLENSIAALPRLFDPKAVPKQFLPWLATWLALELDENWSEIEQRQLIASAFDRYARRGTVAGLRESLRLFAGVNGIIQEPILNAAWWSLPSLTADCKCHSGSAVRTWEATENSILGLTTMLAAAQPQGAVLGTTATLDYSNLITNEEFGSPLFEDVAHQFTVQLYRSQLQCPETLSRVLKVLDREKPAHTVYHLCVIEPRLRVGFQARVGIDTVVGGSAEDLRLGERRINGNVVLGGEPPARIGNQNRIGITTRIG
jgi:phage tail-like protein